MPWYLKEYATDDEMREAEYNDGNLCSCGKHRNQLSRFCSAPHPVSFSEYHKVADELRELKKKLDELTDFINKELEE